MAAPIPQLQDEQPIISDIPIVSRGQGTEELAAGLGSLGASAAQATVESNDIKSKVNMSQSMTDMENLKTNTHVQMINNPGSANQIANAAQQTANSIVSSSFVNKADRADLQKYVAQSTGEIKDFGAMTNYEVNKRTSAFNFYYGLQDNLNAYTHALTTGDQDSAQAIEDATLGHVKGLVAIGAIRPEQAANIVDMFHGMIEGASNHAQMFGNQATTAADYNANQASPLTNKPTYTNVNNPINGNTDALNQYHYGDRTFQDMSAVISQTGTLPQYFAAQFDQLKPDQQQHLIYQSQGVKMAFGDIWSGTSIPQLQSNLTDIDAKGSTLSIEEKGYSDTVKNYLSKLNSGDYLGAVGSTPVGGKILQDSNSAQASILQSTLTDQQKQSALMQNENDTVNKLVSYGQSIHVPGEKIQPINLRDVNTAQSSFAAGGDPNQALNTMGMYSNQNKVYVAQAMKDPVQKVVLNTIALGRDIPLTQQQDYIAANQQGRNYDSILDKVSILPGGSNSDKGIMASIASTPQFKNAMSIIQNQYSTQNVPTIQSSLAKSLVNYVKYQGAISGDLSMSNIKSYVSNAANLLDNAYQPVTGTNYQINSKQMALSNGDASSLAAYTINQAYQHIESTGGTAARIVAADRNPLKMVVSPQNEITVTDSHNNIYWRQPYTPVILGAAKEYVKNNQATAPVPGVISSTVNIYTNKIAQESQNLPFPNAGR